ncbi:MAG: hypothetical protein HY319_10765 [Armatimonadetes bacterium]|nr:hypothetical protein [Armatimonadota bacterium]
MSQPVGTAGLRYPVLLERQVVRPEAWADPSQPSDIDLASLLEEPCRPVALESLVPVVDHTAHDWNPMWKSPEEISYLSSRTGGVDRVYIAGRRRPLFRLGEALSACWSPDGSRLYCLVSSRRRSELRQIGPAADEVARLETGGFQFREVRCTPDGARLLLAGAGGLYALDLSSGGLEGLAGGGLSRPAISPDGRRVSFVDRGQAILELDLGTRRSRELHRAEFRVGPLAYSADGRHLLFLQEEAGDAAGLYALDRHGGGPWLVVPGHFRNLAVGALPQDPESRRSRAMLYQLLLGSPEEREPKPTIERLGEDRVRIGGIVLPRRRLEAA